MAKTKLSNIELVMCVNTSDEYDAVVFTCKNEDIDTLGYYLAEKGRYTLRVCTPEAIEADLEDYDYAITNREPYDKEYPTQDYTAEDYSTIRSGDFISVCTTPEDEIGDSLEAQLSIVLGREQKTGGITYKLLVPGDTKNPIEKIKLQEHNIPFRHISYLMRITA